MGTFLALALALVLVLVLVLEFKFALVFVLPSNPELVEGRSLALSLSHILLHPSSLCPARVVLGCPSLLQIDHQ